MTENINKIIQGDSTEVLKTLESNSIDLIVTDPPYGYSFMGKAWDKALPSVDIWKECLRVLKPGGFAFVMSAPRSDVCSRMSLRLEEAGFKIDYTPIYWTYASGFPKAMNIGKMVDKRNRSEREVLGTSNNPKMPAGDSIGGRLQDVERTEGLITKGNSPLEGSYGGFQPKPAVEVIIVAMKPLSEKTYVDQALRNGKGITWLDNARIPYDSETDKSSATPQGKVTSNLSGGAAPDVDMLLVDYHGEEYWYKSEHKELVRRWLDDEDYVWSELKENLDGVAFTGKIPRIADGDRVLFDATDGTAIRLYQNSRKEVERPELNGRFPANLLVSDDVLNDGRTYKTNPMGTNNNAQSTGTFGVGTITDKAQRKDSGSYSRYFDLDKWANQLPFLIVPKAAKSEKNKGLEGMPTNRKKVSVIQTKGVANDGEWEDGKQLSSPQANHHPTVKPLKLMAYLVTLGSRENDLILDSFCGSGTTLVAAKELKRNYIGIEREAEYVEIAEARLKAVVEDKQMVLNI